MEGMPKISLDNKSVDHENIAKNAEEYGLTVKEYLEIQKEYFRDITNTTRGFRELVEEYKAEKAIWDQEQNELM